MKNRVGEVKAGAGRPFGSVTQKATVEVRERYLASGGKLPLEVMLECMNWYLEDAERRKGERKGESERFSMDSAGAWAERCAPYFHSKLSAIAVPDGSGQLSIEVRWLGE